MGSADRCVFLGIPLVTVQTMIFSRVEGSLCRWMRTRIDLSVRESSESRRQEKYLRSSFSRVTDEECSRVILQIARIAMLKSQRKWSTKFINETIFVQMSF